MDIVNTEITHSLHLYTIQTEGAVIVAIFDLTIKNNRNVMVTVYQVRIHQLITIYAYVVRYANLHIARYSKVQI